MTSSQWKYSTIDSMVLLQFLMYVGILDGFHVVASVASRRISLDFTFILSFHLLNHLGQAR
jgi:hypothetical protein